MAHWESSMEWDQNTEDDQLLDKRAEDIVSGSYHCKSALRSFDSNLKLYLFKTSYNTLTSAVGSEPYNEDILWLLPDFWSCFYKKTHGLDRIFCLHTSKTHSTPSPSFARWSDFIQEKILHGETISEVLECESKIFGMSDNDLRQIITVIKREIETRCGRLLYLNHFLHLVLVVMNYRYNPKRPEIMCLLPGVVFTLEENIRRIKYNEYLSVDVFKEAVRIRTPAYDQIIQKDFMLNLSDKINERLNIVIGSIMISALSRRSYCTYDDDIKLISTVEAILSWGDDLLYRTKNNAFDLIGKYEAYCVSAILMGDDPLIWNNTEFQHNLLDDDQVNNPGLYKHALDLIKILNPLSPYVLSEVHGLWRSWGHPIIDIEGGMKKMEATSLKKSNVDTEETAIGVRTFKLTFFTNYKKKHGHYPLCNLTRKEDFDKYQDHLQMRDAESYDAHQNLYDELSSLHHAIRNNRTIDNHSSSYRHEDWDSVVLLQNFQIPQSLNLATMIKDKAISQTRSELVQSVTLRNSVFDATKRRGVLKWLSEQTSRLRDYLSEVDRNGLKEDDRIIGLYPKERELKTKARFFSLMSYNMRMYITATEEILSKYLLPYFPMITMSDTLLSMIMRLYNMTTSIGKTKTKVVYSMNIDFSKWNQNMREATNAGIFAQIDNIIGFRSLISRTHDIFRKSYLYLCSGEYIPRIIQGSLTTEHPYSRIGDESGKEGLRQKGWTITTVCDILSLAFQHKVQIELIGGGDNQVLTVEVRSLGNNKMLPEEEQLIKVKERMIRFRNALAKKMERRGLPLKLEETWISHRLLMYNKIMYLDGVPLPGRLKVISRIFANANEGICTLGNIASTLGTGFQSVSSKDYTPVLAWVVSRYLTFINLCIYYTANPISCTRRLDQQILKSQDNIRHGIPHFGDEEDLRSSARTKQRKVFTGDRTLSIEELYMIVLYYHKVLGGPGIGSPLSYIMKGFPDTLSEALTYNYKILEEHKIRKTPWYQTIDCITAVNKARVQHWEHLLEDPVSVNHDAPSHGIAALRSQAETVMKNAIIKNQQFKELIKLGNPEYLKTLSTVLCSSDSIEPRLLHDIVGATIPGYVNTVLSKVDQSSTLSKLSTSSDILYEIYCTEMKYYIYLASKCKVRTGHTRSMCPTQDARSLRDLTWGKHILGVTTPHPLAYLECLSHSSSDTECDQSYIAVLNKRPHPYGKMTRGPFRPYFGSYTKEKFKMNVLASAYGEEDILRRAMKIQKLLGWRFEKSSRAYKLIQMILSCVTNADPDKFLPVPEEITGDVEHRYHDMATKHGGIPSNLIRDYTNISCNTSTFIDHSKGASNETLHFQAAIIYCSMMGNIYSIGKEKCSDIYHFHEKCRLCIVPITPKVEDIPESNEINLISCPSNDLMHIDERDIPVHYHSQLSFIKSQEKGSEHGHRVEFHNIEGMGDRASWLSLLIATIVEDISMKQSSLKLMVESCSIFEMAIVIRAMMAIWMYDKRKPHSLYSACDVKDLSLRYKDIIRCIITNKRMMSYLIEEDLIPNVSFSEDDLVIALLDSFPATSLLLLKSSYCKFQDPECKSVKKLIMLSRHPSSSTCYSCTEMIAKTLENNFPSTCGVHGTVDPTMKYHLYSLDKLSRNKGPSMELQDLDASRRKRKRGIDLAASVADNIKKKKERERKARAGSFLLSDSIHTGDIIEHITHPMEKFIITTTYIDGQDTLQETASKTINKEVEYCGKYFSVIIHNLIGLVEAVTGSRRLPKNHSNVQEECTLGIDIQNSVSSVVVWRKVLSVLSYWAEKQNIFVKVRLICGNISQLEDLDTIILEEVVVRTRTSINNKYMSILCNGDWAMDIARESGNCDCLVTSSYRVVPFVSCPVYIITTGDIIYNEASQLTRMIGWDQGWCIEIIRSKVSVNNPPTMLLKCTRGHMRKAYGISESKVLSAIDDSNVEYNYTVHSLAYDNYIDSERSLIHAVLDDLSLKRISIVNEANYIYHLNKIKANIKFHSLQTKSGDPLPWRCLLLIKILIGLEIATDVDKVAAIRYYSCFNSVSFQGRMYRRLFLYKPGESPTLTHGGLKNTLNWTPGGIGKGIVSILENIEKVFYIEYNHQSSLSRIIQL